jgi:formyltetrahydrofolate-dependent phosphoribosylglycinamide formyltransferase
MLSGSGRTLVNLLERIRAGDVPASIEVVIASKECPGAQRARDAGLRTIVEPGVIPSERLESILAPHSIDWVILAGYLKIVRIPARYSGRIVNIHPALLPSFGGPGMYGHHVHEVVLASGARESGCTVHLCDSEFDRGAILVQKRCPVLPGDTPDSLAARVFELEKEAYPEAIRGLILREYPPAARA